MTRTTTGRRRIAGVLLAAASPLAAIEAAAGGPTVTVPGDYATIQEAVDAVQSDLDPGVVVIESDGVFDEAVLINESVLLAAGEGFSPTIERRSAPPLAGPLRVNATEDEPTLVRIFGLTLRLTDGDSVVSLGNNSEDEELRVSFIETTIEGQDVQTGIGAESGQGDLELFVGGSTVEVVGSGVGNPVCVFLTATGFDVSAFLLSNTLRFSRARGLSARGGFEDDELAVVAVANRFESFESGGFTGRSGVEIEGLSTPMGDLSSARAALVNNLFVSNGIALEVGAGRQHQIEVIANNNTVVDSNALGVRLRASGESTMTVGLSNNAIVGTRVDNAGFGGSGVLARVFDPTATIDLVNGHNLFFDNETSDYDGIAMPGPGDVFADPLFVDPAAGDYHLRFGSPAIDAGDNDPFGGTFGGGINDFDLDGGPRILDGDLDGEAVVDLGVYERATQPLEVPALSTSALLGFAALLAAAAAWRLRRRPA